ncbi:MAG: MlaD family protein [Planctomycetota bacterium]
MSKSENLPNETARGEPTIPDAVIRSGAERRFAALRTKLWWLTAVCGLLAIIVAVVSFQTQGTVIHISFEDGHGLKPGDTLRYRGIDAGTVQSIQVANELQTIDVALLLRPGHEALAVEGSQFWIERPRLRLGQISGIDTVLGAKYIGIVPGPAGGTRLSQFTGLETPLRIAKADSESVVIHFPGGEGLEVGDAVRYRGITIGEVTEVVLNEDLTSVTVGVRLVGAAKDFARAGTQFWVERPRLDLTEVRGLDTLLGGRYIAVQPSVDVSEPQTDFVGLGEPPPLPRREGSLEIELDANSRFGLFRGAPITYRGLEVGRVANVGLARDGATVKVNCVIEPEYTDLVRSNSEWWVSGGMQVEASLSGVNARFDSVASLLRGGVAFGTPDSPGDLVVTGHRFRLSPTPQDGWQEWQPRIAVGKHHLEGAKLPDAVRVVARWNDGLASVIGLGRKTVETWGILDEAGLLRVPKAFFDEANQEDHDVSIEVRGKSIALLPETVQVNSFTARLVAPSGIDVEAWPDRMYGKWNGKSVLLIVNPELSEPLALDNTRLAFDGEEGIRIAKGVAISATLEGSPVVDAETLRVVGLAHRLRGVSESWIIRLFL